MLGVTLCQDTGITTRSLADWTFEDTFSELTGLVTLAGCPTRTTVRAGFLKIDTLIVTRCQVIRAFATTFKTDQLPLTYVATSPTMTRVCFEIDTLSLTILKTRATNPHTLACLTDLRAPTGVPTSTTVFCVLLNVHTATGTASLSGGARTHALLTDLAFSTGARTRSTVETIALEIDTPTKANVRCLRRACTEASSCST